MVELVPNKPAEKTSVSPTHETRVQRAIRLTRQSAVPRHLQAVFALDAFTKNNIPDAQILAKGPDLVRKEELTPQSLPTVGLEIEGYFDRDRIIELRELGIKAGKEYQFFPGAQDAVYAGLREVRLPPNRGLVSQMLTNLEQLDIIPGEASLEQYGEENMPSLSMHVNFGFAEGITKEMADSQADAITAISDAFTASYVSAGRIRERKTAQSWAVKEATDPERTGVRGLARVELRTGEIRPTDTQKSIDQTQRVIACLQAYIKLQNRLPISLTERKLALLWRDGFKNEHGQQIVPGFIQAVDRIRSKHGWTPNLADTNKELAAQILEGKHIKEGQLPIKFDMGVIMMDFANEVDKILGTPEQQTVR